MDREFKPLIVINNGTNIRPDWTDRIAISSMYSSDIEPLWESSLGFPDISLTVGQSDLSDLTLNIVSVTRCSRAWEVRNAKTNALVTYEPFDNFYAKHPGQYYLTANSTIMLNPSEVKIFKGLHNGNLALRMEDGIINLKTRDYDLDFEIANSSGAWDERKLLINYFNNITYTHTFAPIIISNIQGIAVSDDTIMHNIDGNETRFYIQELGCYTINKNSDSALTFGDLTSDYFLKKSEVKAINKVTVLSENYYGVEIIHDKGCEIIEMGNVWNKPLWTNNNIGQDVAYNEISEWII